MLNGLDPILIFEFAKLTPAAQESISKIPIVSSIVSKIGLPPIPIYLSEKLTGLYIDTEDRNIDIDTTVDTFSNGADPSFNQKAINTTVRINMIASRESIGLTLLSALTDLIIPKVSSKEYSITYLHGAVTIFRGLLHGFSISQSSSNDLYAITLEIAKVPKKPGAVNVTPVSSASSLSSGSPAATPPTGTMSNGGLPPPPAQSTPAPVRIGGAGT